MKLYETQIDRAVFDKVRKSSPADHSGGFISGDDPAGEEC